MKKGPSHPCFSCTLPDCNEQDRRCALKRALCRYYSARRGREPVTEEIRQARNIAYNELYGDVHRKRSAKWSRQKRAAEALAKEGAAHLLYQNQPPTL